jgi:hypothetical protein
MKALSVNFLGLANLWVDRKPVDPPPIIQLRVSESVDPSQNYLQSNFHSSKKRHFANVSVLISLSLVVSLTMMRRGPR